MVVGRLRFEPGRFSRRFAAFLAGEAVLIAVFVVLVRVHDHSPAYYAKLLLVELAAVVLALATEHAYTKAARRPPS